MWLYQKPIAPEQLSTILSGLPRPATINELLESLPPGIADSDSSFSWDSSESDSESTSVSQAETASTSASEPESVSRQLRF